MLAEADELMMSADGFGQHLIFTPASGVPIQCTGVRSDVTDDLSLFNGPSEQRERWVLPMAQILEQPDTGDGFETTEDGQHYAIDGAAQRKNQTWLCWVVPTDAPEAIFLALRTVDGFGLTAVNGDVIGVAG